MDDFNDYDTTKDLPNIRKVTLSNGSSLTLKREDPYGFWSVHYEKGQVPERLKGLYTSPHEAMKDITNYLEATGKKLKEAPAA